MERQMKNRNYLIVFLIIVFCIGWLALAVRGIRENLMPADKSDCVKIIGEDIPVYPNAQNLTKDGPIKDWRETYTWSFETTDTPETVWKFYIDRLSEKWRGEDRSWEKTPEKKELYLDKACKFTYLIMTSESVENKYKILLQLFSEPGM
jgi:hypothetical protein